MWDAIDQRLPLDRLAALGAAAALLGLAVLAVLVFGQARELRALRTWASARSFHEARHTAEHEPFAVAQDGRVDAASADSDGVEQAFVAHHRAAAAWRGSRIGCSGGDRRRAAG
jgi:hypothetical protein